MIDRLFSAALVFTLLAGGTAAIGKAMLEGRPGVHSAVRTIQLPRVEVIAQRIRPEAMRQVAADTTSQPASNQQ